MTFIINILNMVNKAFTLVELIVVITILAILGTIAFISLNGYSKTARDSTRISDLSTMKTSLELFNLDAGKYPNTTDSFNVTYSGVTVWTQGEFGNTTTNSVDRLDNIPTDPLTERKYTYSVTKTKQEYQLAGLLEGDDVVLNLIDQTNAGDIEATAIVTGNYNGMMIKTLSGGINCEILAIPSIISNQGTAGVDKLLGDIVTNSGFVYDRKNNLPSNYLSSKYKVDDGFDFTPNDLVIYSDNDSCKPIYDADDATQRTELITNLQTAYTGTIIANEGTIAEITTADTEEIANLASVVVNNNLGGEITVNNSLGGSDEISFVPTVLDINKKGAGINLTNGNLVATNINSYQSVVLSEAEVNTGKWYWEVTFTSGSLPNAGIMVPSLANLDSDWPGLHMNTGYGYSTWSPNVLESAVNYHLTGGSAPVIGDTLGFALDLEDDTLEVFLNGISQGGAFSITHNTYSAAFGDGSSAGEATVTFNFGQNPFIGTVPTGFISGLGE